jgi:quinol monooxygenase YgiN
MIVVTAKARVKPEAREEAVRRAAEVAAASRQEAGCLSYRICTDAADPNAFFAFEEWESEAALANHFEQEHTKAFLGYIGGVVDGEITVQRYVVSSVESL